MDQAEKLAEALAPSPKPVYQVLAGLQYAITNCRKSGNKEWEDRHHTRFDKLAVKYIARNTAGDFSCDPQIGFDILKFGVEIQHFKDGVYSERTQHTVTVRPSLAYGFTITVSGRNVNDIKDAIVEMFDSALRQPVPDGDCA